MSEVADELGVRNRERRPRRRRLLACGVRERRDQAARDRIRRDHAEVFPAQLGDREQHTNERTVYSSREALQLTGMRAAVVHTHVDAMLAALPDDGRDAVAKPEG